MFKKDMTYDNIKSHKKLGLHPLSLEDTILASVFHEMSIFLCKNEYSLLKMAYPRILFYLIYLYTLLFILY